MLVAGPYLDLVKKKTSYFYTVWPPRLLKSSTGATFIWGVKYWRPHLKKVDHQDNIKSVSFFLLDNQHHYPLIFLLWKWTLNLLPNRFFFWNNVDVLKFTRKRKSGYWRFSGRNSSAFSLFRNILGTITLILRDGEINNMSKPCFTPSVD